MAIEPRYVVRWEHESISKLPKQAQSIIDILHEHDFNTDKMKDQLWDDDRIIDELDKAKDRGQFKTKQSCKRVFKYYKNLLIDSGKLKVVQLGGEKQQVEIKTSGLTADKIFVPLDSSWWDPEND